MLNVKLEKFMSEVYSSNPEYYFRFPPERFREECEMMLSIQTQMVETKKEGYV
jgi:hypothetical protein